MPKEINNSEKRLLTNLLQLQNLSKRDPESYKYEFSIQWNRFLGLLEQFKISPAIYSKEMVDLTSFLAQVSHCYREDVKELPLLLCDVLHSHGTVLDPSMRMTFVQAVVLLRRKDFVDATYVLQLFFRLFRCQDKLLRKTIFSYIVQDVKNINTKHKNQKLNTTLQNFMYTMLRDSNPMASKMSLDVMIELYRRSVWNDAKTVNVIVTACFRNVTKVLVAAMKFFLGRDQADDQEDSGDDEAEAPRKSVKEILLAHHVGKKCRKRKRKMDRALQMAKKRDKNRKKSDIFDCSALRLVNDSIGFAEKLLSQVRRSNERFEVRLMMIDLISRLIGIHELQLEQFYPFLERFLQPHQKDVTMLLLFAAQASHKLVPPEDLECVLKAITNNFITDVNSGEVMAVGLNAVREICARCPLAMTEDLLQDLAQYKTHRNKGVMMAAKALIHVYRYSNPELLHRRDRGKPTEASHEHKPLRYGEQGTLDSLIPGADILVDEGQDGWKTDSDEKEMMPGDDDDSDGDWVDVPHLSDDEVKDSAVTGERVAEKRKVAQEVSSSRILSQEDFDRIRGIQLAREAGLKMTKSAEKMKRTAAESFTNDGDDLPTLGDIENVHKKRAHDRESRLATVMTGRQDRERFGRGHQRMNPHASTTNKEKLRTKPYTMIKHNKRLKRKCKRSFSEKQVALRNALLKRQKNKR